MNVQPLGYTTILVERLDLVRMVRAFPKTHPVGAHSMDLCDECGAHARLSVALDAQDVRLRSTHRMVNRILADLKAKNYPYEVVVVPYFWPDDGATEPTAHFSILGVPEELAYDLNREFIARIHEEEARERKRLEPALGTSLPASASVRADEYPGWAKTVEQLVDYYGGEVIGHYAPAAAPASSS